MTVKNIGDGVSVAASAPVICTKTIYLRLCLGHTCNAHVHIHMWKEVQTFLDGLDGPGTALSAFTDYISYLMLQQPPPPQQKDNDNTQY